MKVEEADARVSLFFLSSSRADSFSSFSATTPYLLQLRDRLNHRWPNHVAMDIHPQKQPARVLKDGGREGGGGGRQAYTGVLEGAAEEP